MDQATIRLFDDLNEGDWILVKYRVGMGPVTYAEGEFAGFKRTRLRNCLLHIRHVTLIPTADIMHIDVLAHAGCL